jgi:predicted nucleotidyltransferase
MKIRITFKDPDAVYDAVEDAVKATRPAGLSDSEWEEIKENRIQELTLRPFVEWMEYCTVEIDTDAKTAVVIPCN